MAPDDEEPAAPAPRHGVAATRGATPPAAAGIALASRVRSPRYAHLRPILETNQDQPDGRSPWAEPATTGPTGYVRGADYYAGDIR